MGEHFVHGQDEMVGHTWMVGHKWRLVRHVPQWDELSSSNGLRAPRECDHRTKASEPVLSQYKQQSIDHAQHGNLYDCASSKQSVPYETSG
jgi:hypothetical protein